MSATQPVRVGARTSPLALAQTEEILSLLQRRFTDVDFQRVNLSTEGDRRKEAPLSALDRGAFVKDIETALLEDRIDIAIHSAKDLGPDTPDGLAILPVGHRQDTRDALVSRDGLPLALLPAGTRLGTSSPRRTVQIEALRPDIHIMPIRGNVGTRLDKASGMDYDGVVLAAAGLARLGRSSEATEFLPVEHVTPDIGQGVLAAEFRRGDGRIEMMLSSIVFGSTAWAFRAERAFLREIGGGCSVPVGAYARTSGGRLNLLAMVAMPDGARIVRAQVEGRAEAAEDIGRTAAKRLLESEGPQIFDGEHANGCR